MAFTNSPLTFAQAVVAVPGTSVAATNGGIAAPVPENCHTVLVTNPDTVKVGLVGRGVAGGALTAGVTAQRVPPGTTIVLALGTYGIRGIMDQAQQVGTGLVYDSIGGALTLEVTYENTVGSA